MFSRIGDGMKLNFQETDMKINAAWHVSKCSDYKFTGLQKTDKSQRPFLSWSCNFDDSCGFKGGKQSAQRVGKHEGYEPPPTKRVRLDLVALWNDNIFAADSFADLSRHDTVEA
jgi:hypothetical protein